jgi:hypothetical protein
MLALKQTLVVEGALASRFRCDGMANGDAIDEEKRVVQMKQ